MEAGLLAQTFVHDGAIYNRFRVERDQHDGDILAVHYLDAATGHRLAVLND